MNLCKHVNWYMYEGALPEEAYQIIEGKTISLRDKDLDMIVYPYNDWILTIETDDRALNEKQNKLYENFREEITKYNNIHSKVYDILIIKRDEYFTKNTTLRQVLKRISSGICKGYLHGFQQTDEYICGNHGINKKPVFRIIKSI